MIEPFTRQSFVDKIFNSASLDVKGQLWLGTMNDLYKVTINDVADVSTMTGFKSRTHFSNIFKEKYSTTPGKYANAMKKKLQSDVVIQPE